VAGTLVGGAAGDDAPAFTAAVRVADTGNADTDVEALTVFVFFFGGGRGNADEAGPELEARSALAATAAAA
jgi:hypothetical protein